MTKKIFLNTFIVGIAVMLLCAAIFFMMQYNQTIDESFDALEGEADFARAGLMQGGASYLEQFSGAEGVTWFDATGAVLYDSSSPALVGQKTKDHEVTLALLTGVGRDIRRSELTGEKMQYYAVLCEDGTVLRLTKPSVALRRALTSATPLLCVVLLVAFIAGATGFRMTQKVLRPINELNLDDPETAPPYPELEPLLRRIKEQGDTIRLEEQDRQQVRREFSANVSHELKTPLTSISGFAELMRDGMVPPEKMREFSGDIYREAQRMLNMVDDIIRLSRLDEEAGLPERETVDLLNIADEVICALETPAQERRVTVSLRGKSTEVRAVRAVVREMLFNLTENAIKYNLEGGCVTVEVGTEDQKPYFTVSDTGIGIPKQEQERVFERFYRVDKSHSKHVGGTGLGMSIVKHGASYRNAAVKLVSEPGHGTSITVTFPRQK